LVLDYAASTEEAISLIQNYNVRMEQPPIHYLIADSSGHSAVIEYVNGNMIIMRNNDPWQVTTNFIITGMVTYHDASCWRYKTAYQILESKSGVLSEAGALNLLEEVSLNITRWSTVYDLKKGELQLALGADYDVLHHFSVP
jgi:choloylglycine hydrolase